MADWYVYILRCGDNSLYTGISTDINRRVREHNSNDNLAAAYTRARRPLQLVYVESVATRSLALKREHAIRCLTKTAKESLIEIWCRTTKIGED